MLKFYKDEGSYYLFYNTYKNGFLVQEINMQSILVV